MRNRFAGAVALILMASRALALGGHPAPRGAAAATDAAATAGAAATPAPAAGSPAAPASPPATGFLTYLGDFRVPGAFGNGSDDGTNPDFGNSTAYCGNALGFYPDGDPGGGADGFPGSLWMSLRDGTQGGGDAPNTYPVTGRVGEMKIPAPVIGDAESWPIAAKVQDIGGTALGTLWTTQNWARAEWGDCLPIAPQGGMTAPRLITTCRDKYTDWTDRATYQWCNLELAALKVDGPWHVGPVIGGGNANAEVKAAATSFYRKASDYIDWIPDAFVATYLRRTFPAGKALFTGHGDRKAGTQGQGQGPTLKAFAPWLAGDPPRPGAELPFVTLLEYPRPEVGMRTCSLGPDHIDDYHLVDTWSDAVWPSGDLEVGGGRIVNAVLFGGNRCRYAGGYFNEAHIPPKSRLDDCPPQRAGGACGDENTGYCCGDVGDPAPGYLPVLTIYNAEDLGAVADGMIGPSDPQPIATLDLSPYFRGQCTAKLSGMALDDTHGLLYVMEKDGDLGRTNPRPLIHVFRIRRAS